MTTDETITNGTSDPKIDDTETNEKDAVAPEMEGSAKEKEAPSAKKGKKGKNEPKSTEEKAPVMEGSAKENGEKKEEGAAADKDGDVEIIGEKKKKPIKKKIPHWATLSDSVAKASGVNKTGPPGATGITVIIDGIKNCADSKGLASYILIKKYVQKHYPAWPKMTFKGALRRSVDKGRVKKIRNSYKIISEAPVEKKKAVAKVTKKLSKGRSKTTTESVAKEGPLEDLFPHIFTWIVEPKEASYGLIRKYIGKHYPKLSIEAPFKKAILNMVAKGQLDQITGKGASGTFQLENGAKKTGTTYEDPIEDAIIASNEPKDASVGALKHYLSEFHTEYNVKDRPKVLKNAIERAEAKGWITRISGKGFGGTFRLTYPYVPSPKDLWRGDYVDPDEEKPKKPKRKPKKDDSSDDDDSSSEESDSSEEEEEEASESEEESEPEYVPKKGKRGAPSPRGAVPAKRSKVAKKPAPKKKSAPPPKKSSPKKKPVNKKSSSPKKATPKKPVAKKSKYVDDSEEDEESEPEYVPKATKRGAKTPVVAKKSKPAPVVAKKSKPAPVAKKSKPAPVAKKSKPTPAKKSKYQDDSEEDEESEPEYVPKSTKRGAATPKGRSRR